MVVMTAVKDTAAPTVSYPASTALSHKMAAIRYSDPITRRPSRTSLLSRASRVGGGGAASPPGRSVVSTASSAPDRAPSAPPIRASSSSMVRRSCTNATLSVSMTRSRSASAISLPGPAITARLPPSVIRGA
jgi:hypothetical protein